MYLPVGGQMQYMRLRAAARIWVKCFQAAEGRFHDRVFLVIPGGYTHFPEASNNAIVVTLLPAVRRMSRNRSQSPRTNLFEMVQIVGEKGIFQISDVFRLVLSTSREEISASFTRSPRLDSVEFSKGRRKQRVLFHLVEEAGIPEKVVGGKSWKRAIPS
jgi:hypothetical protein